MNKRSRNLIIIAVLVLSNAALAWMLLRKPGRGRPEPREQIIRMLHFDDKQVQQYDSLIALHRSDIRELDRKIRDTRIQLYASLAGGSDSTLRDSLSREVGQLHSSVEQTHYRHFEQIRGLCHADQMEAFGKLSRELARMFSPPPPGKRPR